MGSVQAELDRLQALLLDHSIESTPTAELSTLLTTGRTSAALQQWLSSSLGQRPCQSHVLDSAEPPPCAFGSYMSMAIALQQVQIADLLTDQDIGLYTAVLAQHCN